ncbi:MAG TPA: hypothetical protein VK602_08330 [Phyllobacterium sp.]|nr:hypothetical protein [Phyllobacterium sp.]
MLPQKIARTATRTMKESARRGILQRRPHPIPRGSSPSSRLKPPAIESEPVAIDRFIRLMREQLFPGDVAARKAYLCGIVDAITVSEDKIRIDRSKDNIQPTFRPAGQPTPKVRKSGIGAPFARAATGSNSRPTT